MNFVGAIIGIILVLIILGVVWWAIQQLLPLIPLPEPFARIINVLLILLLVFIVIWIILVLLGFAGVHVPMFHTRAIIRGFATLSTGSTVYL